MQFIQLLLRHCTSLVVHGLHMVTAIRRDVIFSSVFEFKRNYWNARHHIRAYHKILELVSA